MIKTGSGEKYELSYVEKTKVSPTLHRQQFPTCLAPGLLQGIFQVKASTNSMAIPYKFFLHLGHSSMPTLRRYPWDSNRLVLASQSKVSNLDD